MSEQNPVSSSSPSDNFMIISLRNAAVLLPSWPCPRINRKHLIFNRTWRVTIAIGAVAALLSGCRTPQAGPDYALMQQAWEIM